MVGHTALGAWQRVTQSLHLPCIVGRGLLFQVLPSNDMVNSDSAMDIKSCDSDVVIGYWVDEFTCTWSTE